MNKVNELLKELEPAVADPKSCDALEVLSLFRSLRWEILVMENNLFSTKWDKPKEIWCEECGGPVELGECVKCGEEFN
jgi:hypothetical protein